MVKAYSRYTESGNAGRIHCDSVGQTILWSDDGKSLFSCVGTAVVEINTKTGAIVDSVSSSVDSTVDEGLDTSSLAIKQPARSTCIARTSDMLAIGCSDGSTRVVKLPLSETEQLGLFQGHRGNVNAISFSADGTLLVTGGRDTEIVLWDLVNGSGVCRFRGHKGEITQLAFLGADFVISGSKDGQVKIWSVSLQICVQTLTEMKEDVWSIHVSSGRLFVGNAEKFIFVYRLDTSDLVISGDGLTVAQFHGKLDRPDSAEGRVDKIELVGNVLFAQTDRRVVEFWRVVESESEIIKRMKKRGKRKDDEDGELSVSASDEFVILPSPENAAVPMRYVANGRIKSMAVIAKSHLSIQIALALGDNQIELFKLGRTDSSSPLTIRDPRAIAREGHRSGVHAIAVSPARLVSVSSESILVWGAVSMGFQRMIRSPSGDVLSVFFVPGSSDIIILVTKDGHVSLIDLNTGSVVGEVMTLWESTEDEPSRKKKKSDIDQEIKCATLAIVEGNHETESERARTYIVLGCKPCRLVVVELIGNDVSSYSFHVASTISLQDDPVSVAVAPKTGKYVAVGLLNCNIDLLFLDSGKHALALYAHKLPVTSLAFSPDEQVLCSGSVDKNIKVWSIKFGNVLKSIRAHDNAVTCLQFIPYTHLLWSGSRDGVVSLWDIDRFERVLSKVAHPSAEVLAVGMSRDAGMVFSGGSDRFICRLTRSEDQMFIEEEMEKAMELEIDGETRRDDLNVGVTMDVPTKSSLQSVRLVERVVEMIEVDESELTPEDVLEKKIELVKYVAIGIPPAELQQVVISLPTGHARRLLAVIAEVLELIKTKNGSKYPAGFPIEACVSAAMFLIQAQAKYLIGEPHARQVLLKLKDLFHDAVDQEIQHIGIAAASIRFL
jgi:U3 small nucleolar RNA-associated protein 12